MKRTYLLSALIAALVVGTAFLPACAEEISTPTATVAPGETSTATPKETPTVQQEAKIFKWRVQSALPPGKMPSFLDDIATMSDGRLQLTCFPAGALVIIPNTTPSVSDGTVEAALWPTSLDFGKGRAAILFSSIPFGFTTPEQYVDWMLHHGGLEFCQELYGQWNIHALIAGVSYPKVGGMSREPFTSSADVNSKLWRASGLPQEVLLEAGVPVQKLLSAQVYLALEKSVVDITDFSSLAGNYRAGYHEIAKYWYGPGWQNSAGGSLMLLINKDKWDELPDDLKKIVEYTCLGTVAKIPGLSRRMDMEAMEACIEYGVEFNRLPDEYLAMLAAATDRVLDAYAAENDLFRRTLESYRTYVERESKLHDIVSDISFAK